MGAIEVRMKIVEAEAVHCGIGRCRVEMRGIHLGEFAPGSDFRRRYIFPVFACVPRDLNNAIVGSGPDQLRVFWRWSDGIDDAAMLALRGIVVDERAKRSWNTRIFASEVRTDDLPTV